MKIGLKIPLNSHKASSVIILIAVLVVLSLFGAPVFSASSPTCSSCHGSVYSQQLKFLEGDSQNIIPSVIQVGQTLNVTVALENIDNASRYFLLSDVSANLTSKNNHFSINSSTYSIGTMAPGIVMINWQITGTSMGSDELELTVTGINDHGHVPFSDQYLPSPSITISGTASSTPTSKGTPQPTSPATTLPTLTATPSPTPSTTARNQNHELSSNMLCIHPPLAVSSYFFIFLFTVAVIKEVKNKKTTTVLGAAAWSLTGLGLLTGMIWAQITWGSYWSWDPKETLTLILFLTFSAAQIAYIERKTMITKWLLIFSCILGVITALGSFIGTGLHSFA